MRMHGVCRRLHRVRRTKEEERKGRRKGREMEIEGKIENHKERRTLHLGVESNKLNSEGSVRG